ncbi:hypothetical protein [Deinococcus ruber]|uniref:Uncharacterized protein n=1 Tax=Deinococcus ruber TaxID=1848197 RepID=A0A918C7N6_9DEIO|nr:hypothetical protein [Deinococcus ruber]GGR09812.1 hypothetical protein GCM10008957_23220 [Deinococcus ruber]
MIHFQHAPYEVIAATAAQAPSNSWEQELRYLAGQYQPMSDREVFSLAQIALEKAPGERAQRLGAGADASEQEAATRQDALDAQDLLFRHVLPVVLTAARQWTARFSSWRASLDAAINIARQNLPRVVETMTGPRAGTKTARGWNPHLATLRLHGWVRMALDLEMVKAARALSQSVDSGFLEDVSWAKKANREFQEALGNDLRWWPEYWVVRSVATKPAAPLLKGRRNVLPKKGKVPAYLNEADVMVEYEDESGPILIHEHRRYPLGARPGLPGNRYTQKWVQQQPLQLKAPLHLQKAALFDLRMRRDRELSATLSERWLRSLAALQYWAAVPDAVQKAELQAYEHLTGKKVKAFTPSMLRGFTSSDRENFAAAQLRSVRSLLNRQSRRLTGLMRPGWAASLLSGTVADSLDAPLSLDDQGFTALDVTLKDNDASATVEGRFDHIEAVNEGVGPRYRAPLVPGERVQLAQQLTNLPAVLVNTVLHGNVKALSRAHAAMVKESRIQQRWLRACEQADLPPREAREIAQAALTYVHARFSAKLGAAEFAGLKKFVQLFRKGEAALGFGGRREHVPVLTLVSEYRRFGRYTGEAESLWLAACREQHLTPAQALELIQRLPVNLQRRDAPRVRQHRHQPASREFTRFVQKHGERQVALIDGLALEVGQRVTALRSQERHAANDLLAIGKRAPLSRVRAVRVGREFIVQEPLAPTVLGDNALSVWRATLENAQSALTAALERLEQATNVGHLFAVAEAELQAEVAVQEAQALLLGEDWIVDALAGMTPAAGASDTSRASSAAAQQYSLHN